MSTSDEHNQYAAPETTVSFAIKITEINQLIQILNIFHLYSTVRKPDVIFKLEEGENPWLLEEEPLNGSH